jgi:hypothetical protein
MFFSLKVSKLIPFAEWLFFSQRKIIFNFNQNQNKKKTEQKTIESHIIPFIVVCWYIVLISSKVKHNSAKKKKKIAKKFMNTMTTLSRKIKRS